MDPTRPTTRHHGPTPPLPKLRSLRELLPTTPAHASTPADPAQPIDYRALRKRQAQARAASLPKWLERANSVLTKPKPEHSVEPPLDAYVEQADGGAPYVRATPQYRGWFGCTYVVDVDTVASPGRGAVQPASGDRERELSF